MTSSPTATGTSPTSARLVDAMDPFVVSAHYAGEAFLDLKANLGRAVDKVSYGSLREHIAFFGLGTYLKHASEQLGTQLGDGFRELASHGLRESFALAVARHAPSKETCRVVGRLLTHIDVVVRWSLIAREPVPAGSTRLARFAQSLRETQTPILDDWSSAVERLRASPWHVDPATCILRYREGANDADRLEIHPRSAMHQLTVTPWEKARVQRYG